MIDRRETLDFTARGSVDGCEQRAELRFVLSDATLVGVTIRCVNSLTFAGASASW